MVKLMAELKTLVSVIVFKGFVFPFFLPDVNGLFYFLMKWKSEGQNIRSNFFYILQSFILEDYVHSEN